MSVSANQSGVSRTAWWIAVALLSIAAIVDLQDPNALKLMTTGLFLAGSLLAALTPAPRAQLTRLAIYGLFFAGVSLIAYRAFGPGL